PFCPLLLSLSHRAPSPSTHVCLCRIITKKENRQRLNISLFVAPSHYRLFNQTSGGQKGILTSAAFFFHSSGNICLTYIHPSFAYFLVDTRTLAAMASTLPSVAPTTDIPHTTVTSPSPTTTDTTTTTTTITTTTPPPQSSSPSSPPTSPSTPSTSDNPSPSPSPTSDPGTGGGGGSKSPSKTSKSATKTSSGNSPSQLPGGTGSGDGGTGSGGTGIDGSGNSTSSDSTNGGGSKSLIGPIIGGIAAVLVVAFLVGVFVMRYRKKNKERQRRLDILFDSNGQGQDQVQALGLGGADGGAGPNASSGKPRASSIHSSGARPSTHLEMAAIGGGGAALAGAAAMHHNNDGYQYDYQQGYNNHVPYGGYQDQYEQYDQYDPYYQQPAQPLPSSQSGAQLPPVGYYSESPNLAYSQSAQQQQQQHLSYGTGSPSVAQSSVASPQISYPPPPPATGASPLTPPHQQATTTGGTPGETYDRFNKIEARDYANTQSPARNPQIITEDNVKVSL
ncbi:hypothetical protein EDD21DRAFT_109222, partial [Dissophora ornata]